MSKYFFLRLIFFFLLVLGLSGCSISTRVVTGDVTDYDTEQPISGAEVVLTSTGWGFRKGLLVWDKVTPFGGLTDDQGAFSISARKDATGVMVSKAGYETHYGWIDFAQPVHIRLTKVDTSKAGVLPASLLQVGFVGSESYGWIFSRNELSRELDEADLILKSVPSNLEKVILEAPGNGGIAFISAKELGVKSDFLSQGNIAPSTGYIKQVELSLTKGSEGPAGLYFVRTNDGQHYAKFSFGPGEYQLMGLEQEHLQGRWGLMFHYIYNSAGQKNLQYQ